jgi:hypothetical protein
MRCCLHALGATVSPNAPEALAGRRIARGPYLVTRKSGPKGDGRSAHHATHDMQDLMQIARGGVRLGIQPQDVDQDFSAQPMPGRECEQLDKCQTKRVQRRLRDLPSRTNPHTGPTRRVRVTELLERDLPRPRSGRELAEHIGVKPRNMLTQLAKWTPPRLPHPNQRRCLRTPDSP